MCIFFSLIWFNSSKNLKIVETGRFHIDVNPNKSHCDRKTVMILNFSSGRGRDWGFPHVSQSIKNRCHKQRVTNRGGGGALTKTHLNVASQRSDLSTNSHIGSPNNKTALALIANIYSDQTTPLNASEGHLCEI